MMGSTRLLLFWSVFFLTSTFDLVLAAGNLKGVQHFQDDGHTIRQLETVFMEDGNEPTTGNEEERHIRDFGPRVNSFVMSHAHLPHKDEPSTLRTADDASQHVKVSDDNLGKAKTAGIVAKEEPIGHYEQYYDYDRRLEVIGLAVAVFGMLMAVVTAAISSRHPK
uniref:Uncharacterized protein n=1 Tax=Peronospora matthiolae TaxID=2874970 RepID=A0AAV1V1N2_9STRA